MTADRPTPPQPNTASHSPGRSCARPVSADQAVVIRHPMAAATAGSSPSGKGERLVSANGTATNSAYAPGALNPGSTCASQMVCAPDWHVEQVPQARMNGAITLSPTCQRVTPAPTDTTSPQNSCPKTSGRGAGSAPLQTCQSDRHTPQAMTRRTTAPSVATGSGTCATSRGLRTAVISAARISLPARSGSFQSLYWPRVFHTFQ